MSNNKIVIPQSLCVFDEHETDREQGQARNVSRSIRRRNTASRELYTILNQIARKLNAVDALDSGTATAAQIVQALQK